MINRWFKDCSKAGIGERVAEKTSILSALVRLGFHKRIRVKVRKRDPQSINVSLGSILVGCPDAGRNDIGKIVKARASDLLKYFQCV